MIDLEPVRLYKDEQGDSKSSLAGPFQGLALHSTDVHKLNPRDPHSFKRRREESTESEDRASSTERENDTTHPTMDEEEAARAQAEDTAFLKPEHLAGIPMSASLHRRIKTSIADLYVKQQLLPALILLAHARLLGRPELENAADYARTAQRLAETLGASKALHARCSFYIGLAELLLSRISASAISRPESFNSADNWRAKSPSYLQHFQTATAAKGVYAEGRWAEEYVTYLKKEERQPDSPADSEMSPQSQTSWVGKLWGAIRRRRTQSLESSDADEESNNAGDDWKVADEDLPDLDSEFESDADEEKEANTAFHSIENIDDYESTAMPGRYCTPSPLSPRSPSPAEPLLPVFSPTATQSPPSTPASPTGRTIRCRVVSFVDGTAEITSSTPEQQDSSLSHRRNRSITALITRRERLPSQEEQMEEGLSPFMATFGEDVRKKLE
ncbi:hypothetical protein BDY17DRAFT_323880 [Neohortaea acidophila]|uniref:Uncharacterized protein n=1 Tax=Neohortaea acidophila TaxID=245834 RepID=A0A6A6PSP1_9PEZI|nr:uncharacterized protein BDY17DRAFT_323880 [Neohortaea acidophila]KAF2483119.1 hypothetical protein BDY17DRAFT_323880 [Neohortaea acidophila]